MKIFGNLGTNLAKLKYWISQSFQKVQKCFFKIVNKEMLIEGALRDNKLFYSCPKTVKGAEKNK